MADTTVTQAFTAEEMRRVDWSEETQAKNHPVRVIVEPDVIRDQRTGEVIAAIRPGYRWYWAHSHIHVAPQGWNGLEAREAWEERNQISRQRMDDNGQAIIQLIQRLTGQPLTGIGPSTEEKHNA